MYKKMVIPTVVVLFTFACGLIPATPVNKYPTQNPVYTATLWPSVSTRTPDLSFVVGQTYWVNGVEPEGFLIQGMPNEWTTLYNKPSDDVSDSTVTWLFFIPAGEPVRVDGVEGRFCYVVGEDPEAMAKVPFDGECFFDGWMECKYLLSFQPTPLPTPNLTPQRP